MKVNQSKPISHKYTKTEKELITSCNMKLQYNHVTGMSAAKIYSILAT